MGATFSEVERNLIVAVYDGDSHGETLLGIEGEPPTRIGDVVDANIEDADVLQVIRKALDEKSAEIVIAGWVGSYSRLVLLGKGW